MLSAITFEIVLVLLLLGIFAGIMAGLLGVGGGLIIVPALVFLFEYWQFSSSYLTQMAVATSLGTIIFTSISSVFSHHKHGLIDWKLVFHLSIGISLGALAGAFIASQLVGNLLRLLFGMFALLVAAQMFFGFRPKAQRHLPGMFGQGVSGFFIAVISSIFGIGGGSLTVPLLSYFGVDMKRSVAVSAACGFPIALFAVLGFIAAGQGLENLPEGSVGYLYLPALVIISIGSVLAAPLGASLAYRLPAAKLKRIFSLFLSIVGLRLIVSSF